MKKDHVDYIISQWKREMKDVDVSPMAVIGRLSRVAEHLNKLLQKNYSKYSINGGEFDVLASLRRTGEPYQLTPTELYNSLMITSGTITNRLDRLEKTGLISRSPNPEDRRGTLVTLTKKGITLMNEAYPAHITHEEGLLNTLSNDERSTLISLLRKLLISYEAEDNSI
jgi:DNA-binding MarR family transcriptional regulator